MSEYIRKVAYIYLYKGNQKVKSIGYIKMDVRGKECTVRVHIKGIYSQEIKSCKAYMLLPINTVMNTVYIGDIEIKNNLGDYKAVYPYDNIADSGYGGEVFSGIVFESKNKYIWGALWDDGIIELDKIIQESSEEAARIEAVGKKAVKKEAVRAEAVGKEQVKKEAVRRKAGEKVAARRETVWAGAESPMRQENSVGQGGQTGSGQQENFQSMGGWESLCRTYSAIHPFESHDEKKYISITPEALTRMGQEGIVLSNNSFLLHGYYNYKYLILGMAEHSLEEGYSLGVPGTYHEREQMMATMFGFESFKSARKQELLPGSFGYYIKNIKP